MKFEQLISSMMKISVSARLWHWMTGVAQHHVSFEQFLTQNQILTDSLMESALGNDYQLNLEDVGVQNAIQKNYSIESVTGEIKNYRQLILESKNHFENSDKNGAQELVTILDDVVELCSKTIYLLKLK